MLLRDDFAGPINHVSRLYNLSSVDMNVFFFYRSYKSEDTKGQRMMWLSSVTRVRHKDYNKNTVPTPQHGSELT